MNDFFSQFMNFERMLANIDIPSPYQCIVWNVWCTFGIYSKFCIGIPNCYTLPSTKTMKNWHSFIFSRHEQKFVVWRPIIKLTHIFLFFFVYMSGNLGPLHMCGNFSAEPILEHIYATKLLDSFFG